MKIDHETGAVRGLARGLELEGTWQVRRDGRATPRSVIEQPYSTVTLLAKFLG
jgi:hypothetical protein